MVSLVQKIEEEFKCDHYSRNCSIIAPCCDKEFDCRICHDNFYEDIEKDYKKKHKIDRYKIKEIICKKCKTRQKK